MSQLSEFLLKRRYVVVRNMAEPGPNSEDLEKILREGMRVPDHGRLTPWRFIVIRGDARMKMGKILGKAFTSIFCLFVALFFIQSNMIGGGILQSYTSILVDNHRHTYIYIYIYRLRAHMLVAYHKEGSLI